MSAAKKSSAKKTSAKGSKTSRKPARAKATKKTTAGKKTAVKKTAKKGSGTKKSTAGKTGAKKTPKTTTKKAAARKTVKKESPAKAPPAKKASKKASAKKSPAKKTSAKKTSAKKTSAKTTRKAASSGGPIMSRPPAPKRRVRPAKLDKKTLASIREKLETDRAELEAQLQEIERDSITESEDTGLHEDFADAGTSTFERERDLSIKNNVLDLLDQVKRAIARIDEGGYGTCESCGNPIDAARIKAFPRVLMCLDCKRRDERTR